MGKASLASSVAQIELILANFAAILTQKEYVPFGLLGIMGGSESVFH